MGLSLDKSLSHRYGAPQHSCCTAQIGDIAMNLQIENTISRIADEARGRFNKILKDARYQTQSAADAVSKGKGPVKTVSKLGLKLTATTHKTADKVLKQQTKMVENQIDEFASRLHAVAGATGLKDLVDTQVRLIPKHASRFVGDARETLTIIAGAGQEVGSLLKGTVAELRGVSKPVAKKAKAKKAKAAPKKTPAKKVAAKKPAAKKAAPKKAAPIVTETIVDVVAEPKAA